MANHSGPMACPVDGSTLVMSERSGIEIDYCPTCRGVWLDRGELEKLMAAATDEGRASAPAATAYAPAPQQPQQPWGGQPTYREPPRHRDDRYDHDRRRDDDYHYRKKKKRLDIFDIFD